MRTCRISRYLYRYIPVSWPMCEKPYCSASASWYASMLPRRNCTLQSTIIFVRRRISRVRWNALPKRDFFRSFVVSTLIGFRLKL